MSDFLLQLSLQKLEPAIDLLVERISAKLSDALPSSDPEVLLSKVKAARLCGVSLRTFERWNRDGRCPSPIRVNGVVRWARRTLAKWVDDGCPNCQLQESSESEDAES